MHKHSTYCVGVHRQMCAYKVASPRRQAGLLGRGGVHQLKFVLPRQEALYAVQGCLDQGAACRLGRCTRQLGPHTAAAMSLLQMTGAQGGGYT